ncbi:unnamed protein product [Protopolystoma xenopodis]|uniref:Uncharacterized protein n=1 Tax=Protopolystoma xenopodis TaxID=117903 RepID=A0A3S5A9X9_9PLAT|nr:unnamed protein product [Protopolystoma xenopodis]
MKQNLGLLRRGVGGGRGGQETCCSVCPLGQQTRKQPSSSQQSASRHPIGQLHTIFGPASTQTDRAGDRPSRAAAWGLVNAVRMGPPARQLTQENPQHCGRAEEAGESPHLEAETGTQTDR